MFKMNAGYCVYKAIEEVQKVLDNAFKVQRGDSEIMELQKLADEYSKTDFPQVKDYPHPFIVVEGLDGVGKFKI